MGFPGLEYGLFGHGACPARCSRRRHRRSCPRPSQRGVRRAPPRRLGATWQETPPAVGEMGESWVNHGQIMSGIWWRLI